jgi:hypothetical protein
MKIFRDFVTEYVVFIMLEILEENVFWLIVDVLLRDKIGKKRFNKYWFL